jgi:penicillin-insensitive murein endopeptidase
VPGVRTALLAASLSIAPAAAQDNPWARFAWPAPGMAEVFGSAVAGCIRGAVRLPDDGPGYRAVRVSRNRHFGHPATIAFTRALAAAALREGLETLYIGDLSQPRGGPMPYGHASHQTGMDVDIWFNLRPKPAREPVELRENIPLPSLVLAGPPPRIDPAQFQPGHVTLLRLAATAKGVDRVLVNPAIKQHLCTTLPPAERGWIRKLRPWWGHDAHMHVHLACPADSASCTDPPAIPAGDGCDASLAWWFEQPPVPPAPARPSAPRSLPAACDGLRRLP